MVRMKKCFYFVVIILAVVICTLILEPKFGLFNNNEVKIKKTTSTSSISIDSCFGGVTSHLNRKVLAFCLFGDNATKTYGRKIRKLAKESTGSVLYHSWEMLIYSNIDIPKKLQRKTQKLNPLVKFCDVRNLLHVNSKLKEINAMTWRFIPMADKSVDMFCSRDLDSPLLTREMDAVSEWVESNKTLHVMRDNSKHKSQVMGGMWCFRNNKNYSLGIELVHEVWKNAMRRNSTHEALVGNDQILLNKIVWPRLVHDVMHHDSYLCNWLQGARPFPSKREKGTFVGCKRKCAYEMNKCPVRCRPRQHKDWEYC